MASRNPYSDLLRGAPVSAIDAVGKNPYSDLLRASSVPESPGLISRGLHTVGSVLGAPKAGIDALYRASARNLFGLPVADDATVGQAIRAGFGLSQGDEGYGGRLAGKAIEFGGDLALDPTTWAMAGLGGAARAGRTAEAAIAGAERLAPEALGALVPEAAEAATKLVGPGRLAGRVGTGAGLAFTGLMGTGALQEGSRAIERIRHEGFTPQAAEETLGTLLAAGGAGLGALHLLPGERAPKVVEEPAVEAETPPRIPTPEPPPAGWKQEAWRQHMAEQGILGQEPPPAIERARPGAPPPPPIETPLGPRELPPEPPPEPLGPSSFFEPPRPSRYRPEDFVVGEEPPVEALGPSSIFEPPPSRPYHPEDFIVGERPPVPQVWDRPAPSGFRMAGPEDVYVGEGQPVRLQEPPPIRLGEEPPPPSPPTEGLTSPSLFEPSPYLYGPEDFYLGPEEPGGLPAIERRPPPQQMALPGVQRAGQLTLDEALRQAEPTPAIEANAPVPPLPGGGEPPPAPTPAPVPPQRPPGAPPAAAAAAVPSPREATGRPVTIAATGQQGTVLGGRHGRYSVQFEDGSTKAFSAKELDFAPPEAPAPAGETPVGGPKPYSERRQQTVEPEAERRGGFDRRAAIADRRLAIANRLQELGYEAHPEVVDWIQDLERQRDTDALTGLFNMGAHTRDIQDPAARGHVSMDLAGLKKINDTVGHDAGDSYLQGVSQVLQQIADEMGVRLYRKGGDEFAIIARDETYAKAVAQEMKRRLRGLERPVRIKYVDPSGNVLATWDGARIDYGYGQTFPEADKHLIAFRKRAENYPADHPEHRIPYRKPTDEAAGAGGDGGDGQRPAGAERSADERGGVREVDRQLAAGGDVQGGVGASDAGGGVQAQGAEPGQAGAGGPAEAGVAEPLGPRDRRQAPRSPGPPVPSAEDVPLQDLLSPEQLQGLVEEYKASPAVATRMVQQTLRERAPEVMDVVRRLARRGTGQRGRVYKSRGGREGETATESETAPPVNQDVQEAPAVAPAKSPEAVALQGLRSAAAAKGARGIKKQWGIDRPELAGVGEQTIVKAIDEDADNPTYKKLEAALAENRQEAKAGGVADVTDVEADKFLNDALATLDQGDPKGNKYTQGFISRKAELGMDVDELKFYGARRLATAIRKDADNPIYLKAREAAKRSILEGRRLEAESRSFEPSEIIEPEGEVDTSFNPEEYEAAAAQEGAATAPTPSTARALWSHVKPWTPEPGRPTVRGGVVEPGQATMFPGRDMLQGTERRVTEGREGEGPLFTQEADTRARAEEAAQQTIPSEPPATEAPPTPPPAETQTYKGFTLQPSEGGGVDVIDASGRARANVNDLTAARRYIDRKGPKYSVTEAGTVAAPVDTEAVGRAFPTGKVQESEGGGWDVTLPNGRRITIRQAEDGGIEYNAEAFQAGRGREKGATEQLAGSWQLLDREGVITLAKAAGVGKLRHEAFHAAMDMALTPGEKAAVLKKYGSEEAAAEAYETWDLAQPNTWFSKILAFAKRIYRSFRPSWESAFEAAHTGKAFERAASEAPAEAGQPKYATAAPPTPSVASGGAARKTAAQMAAQKHGLWDMFLEEHKAGLVSAPGSISANPASNVGEAGARVAESFAAGPVDALLSKLVGGGRTRYSAEGMDQLRGAAANLGKAWETAKTKFNPKNLLGAGNIGAIPGKAGKVIRTPFMLLDAGDATTAALNEGAVSHQLAGRSARQQLPNGTSQDIAALREKLIKNPSKALTEAVRKEVNDRQFKKEDPNALVKFLSDLRRKYPWLQVAMPFVEVPGNIAELTLKRSPLGFIEAGRAFNTFREAVKKNAPQATIDRLKGEAVDKITRPLVGTTMLGMFGLMAKAGAMTGSGPTDPRERATLRESGWQPYSFVIPAGSPLGNDRRIYVPFNRFQPVSATLGYAADLAEATNSKDANEVYAKALGSIGPNLLSTQYLQGLSEAAAFINDPTKAGAKYLSDLAGSLVPNVVAKAAQAYDPTVRDVRPEETGFAGLPSQIAKTVASRIPGLSTTLPVRRSGTGMPVERAGTAFTRFALPFQPSAEKEGGDFQQLLVDLSASPTPPGRELTIPGSKGRKVQLSEDELDVITAADQKATEYLRRAVKSPTFQRMDAEDQKAVIQRIYAQYRTEARQRLYRQPEFARKAKAVLKEQRV